MADVSNSALDRRALRTGRRADGTPARVTRRRAETRERLLAAALAVFAERGFGRAGIEEICETAGYTRGAFYSNFDSLDELFFALYEQQAAHTMTQVHAALAGATPDEGLPSLLDRVISALLIDRTWVLVRTDFLLHAARDPQTAAALIRHREAIRETLQPVVVGAVDLAAMPPALRDPEALTAAVVTVHDAAATRLLLEPDLTTLRPWLRDMLTALLSPRG
ncbi:TetR/AcrR family transcriptional regulator [Streptomyces sp. NEAU-Y11]|uniref:TetR/AcrR family transcriptional regulator n=1 Tax=Streptomyces cucumeris TaxID=2962890 RepID=UPI0020C936C6|nr:TetR/AcrR family transcriptional regulator [Streptomyces sp. NEAU-Y11]MCP9211987.1 TetR/AcrR family transcriptional regulator [Streptomyces sp. NEAU-Y11]